MKQGSFRACSMRTITNCTAKHTRMNGFGYIVTDGSSLTVLPVDAKERTVDADGNKND